MFNIIIRETEEDIGKEAFRLFKETVAAKRNPVLGLATGSSPLPLYEEIVRDHEENGFSYNNCVTFNLDEYVGLAKDHDQSYYTFMHRHLFDALDIPEENIHIPQACGISPEKGAADFEKTISRYVVDVQILGIGSDGHIAFNEPGTPFDSLTHVSDLDERTIADNARFFGGDTTLVPRQAITQGLSTIMRAEKIILLASGTNKASAVRDMIKGEMSVTCPASILQNHHDVTVILDHQAAGLL